MAEFNSNINIEAQGIEDFVRGLEQVEREIKIIERELRSVGLPEAQIRRQAQSFRRELQNIERVRVRASDQAQREIRRQVETTSDLRQRQLNTLRDVSVEAVGVFTGGSLGEVFSGIASRISETVDRFSEVNDNARIASSAFTSVGTSIENITLGFLSVIAPLLFAVDEILQATGLAADQFNEVAQSIQAASTALSESVEAASSLETLEASLELRQRNLETIREEQDALLETSDEFSRQIEIVQDFNQSFERRLELYETIQAANSDLLLTDVSRITNQDQLNQAFTDGQTILRRRLITARSTRQLEQARLRVAITLQRISEGQNNLSAENLALLDRQLQTQQDNVRRAEEGLLIAQNNDRVISNTADSEERITRAINSRDRTIELRSNATLGVARDVQDDIEEAIATGELQRARQLIAELGDVRDAYSDITEEIGVAEETQVTLNRDLIQATTAADNFTQGLGAIQDVLGSGSGLMEFVNTDALINTFPESIRSSITEAIEEFGDLNAATTEFFQTPSLNAAQADAAFAAAAAATSDFREQLELLEAAGITSNILAPLVSDLESRETQIESITAEIARNQAIIDQTGVDAAARQEELNERILQAERSLADRREQIQLAANDAVGNLLATNRDLFSQLGQSDILDEFSRVEQEFANTNAGIIAQIEEDLLNLNNVAGEVTATVTTAAGSTSVAFLDDDLRDANSVLSEVLVERVQLLINTRELQQRELESLQTRFTDDELAGFARRFREEIRLREAALGQTQVDLQNGLENLRDTRTNFDNRAQLEQRQLNEEEIDILNTQIGRLFELEVDRFRQERFLRVGAFVNELEDIENRGGDVEQATAEFNLREARLLLTHRKNLQGIANNTPVVTEEANRMTAEMFVQLATQVTDSFQGLFDAYLAYQDSVGQAAIDAIQRQLDNINTEISSTTGNINSLEDDLQNSRSGRRDALLRGIAIEQEREEVLTERRIALQRELEREERRQAQRRQAAAIAQALINGALAITNVWANNTIPYPAALAFNIPQTAILAGITAFEVATISNQTFADGGLLNGPSHAQGGIPFTVGGVPGFEAEGGEAIINKRSTAMFRPLLSAMNEAGGGVKFQTGGLTPANFDAVSESLSGSQRRQIDALSMMNLFVNVTDISNLQGTVAQATDVTSI